MESAAQRSRTTGPTRKPWSVLARSRSVRAVLGSGVVAAAFVWALPRFAAYGDVGRHLTRVRGPAAAGLVVLAACNLVAPAFMHWASVPGLRLYRAMIADWVTSAITNVLPGGSALAIGMTWRMYRSWDVERRAIARSVVVTGVWDTFVKLGTPLLALLWLSTERTLDAGLIQATVIGAALFAATLGLGAVVLAGPAVGLRLGRLLDGFRVLGRGWPDRLAHLRTDTVELLRDRWLPLSLWTLVGHANYYLLLVMCLRAVGIEGHRLSPAAVLAAFAFGRLVTAVPLTPGGLGVLEVGLAGALTAVGDAPEAAVVAAVLLFRFCSFVLPIPLGALSWLLWSTRPHRHGNNDHGAPTPSPDVVVTTSP